MQIIFECNVTPGHSHGAIKQLLKVTASKSNAFYICSASECHYRGKVDKGVSKLFIPV